MLIGGLYDLRTNNTLISYIYLCCVDTWKQLYTYTLGCYRSDCVRLCWWISWSVVSKHCYCHPVKDTLPTWKLLHLTLDNIVGKFLLFYWYIPRFYLVPGSCTSIYLLSIHNQLSTTRFYVVPYIPSWFLLGLPIIILKVAFVSDWLQCIHLIGSCHRWIPPILLFTSWRSLKKVFRILE